MCKSWTTPISPSWGWWPAIFQGLNWCMVSLVAQMVKNLLAVWETLVQYLDQEDPLEKGMATHSSILAWEIPGTEEPGGLQSMGSQKSQTWPSNSTPTIAPTSSSFMPWERIKCVNLCQALSTVPRTYGVRHQCSLWSLFSFSLNWNVQAI